MNRLFTYYRIISLKTAFDSLVGKVTVLINTRICLRLQYMSNADKLNAIQTYADRGLMTRNELREISNLPPLPEPYGSQIPARGEYYDITRPPADKTGTNEPEAPAENAEDGGGE